MMVQVQEMINLRVFISHHRTKMPIISCTYGLYLCKIAKCEQTTHGNISTLSHLLYATINETFRCLLHVCLNLDPIDCNGELIINLINQKQILSNMKLNLLASSALALLSVVPSVYSQVSLLYLCNCN